MAAAGPVIFSSLGTWMGSVDAQESSGESLAVERRGQQSTRWHLPPGFQKPTFPQENVRLHSPTGGVDVLLMANFCPLRLPS